MVRYRNLEVIRVSLGGQELSRDVCKDIKGTWMTTVRGSGSPCSRKPREREGLRQRGSFGSLAL